MTFNCRFSIISKWNNSYLFQDGYADSDREDNINLVLQYKHQVVLYMQHVSKYNLNSNYDVMFVFCSVLQVLLLLLPVTNTNVRSKLRFHILILIWLQIKDRDLQRVFISLKYSYLSHCLYLQNVIDKRKAFTFPCPMIMTKSFFT